MGTLISLTTRKSIHADVVKWLIKQSNDHGIDIVNTPMPLEHARNLQVERFLSSPYEYLFIVDSDCVPQDNTVEKLMAYQFPFITAPHPTIKGNETGVMVLDSDGNGDYVQHIPFDKGLQECDAVGCAGMLFHRSVFERLDKPYFKFIFNDDGYLVKGEDFYICDKMKQAGIKIYADCNLIQTHNVGVSI